MRATALAVQLDSCQDEESNRVAHLLVPVERFDFCEFFEGHTRASGWFADRFGNIRRHFCGDFFGSLSNGGLILDETLFYTDGMIERRQWEVDVSEHGVLTAHSDSLIQGARGVVRENTLTMTYDMRVQIDDGKIWNLSMKDKMILQPDGSVHNITQVYKWGFRIGTVSAQYVRHEGDRLCSTSEAARNVLCMRRTSSRLFSVSD